MKKLKVIIPLILILMAIVATPVLASDITDAKWTGDIKVTNAGTAASGVATVFDLDEDILISGNYILNDLSNLAIRDPSGADAAYMPGWGADPWCLHVPSIGAGGIQNYRFYAGGATPMGGKMAYFPGDAGLTINDAAALEPGADAYEFEISGLVGQAGSVVSKPNAIGIAPLAETLDFYTGADRDNQQDFLKSYYWSQGFTPSESMTVTSMQLKLSKSGTPPANIDYGIYLAAAGVPTGNALSTGSLPTADIGDTALWRNCPLTPVTLTGGTQYCIRLTKSGSTGNTVNIQMVSSDAYAAGARAYSADGSTGTLHASGYDIAFVIAGQACCKGSHYTFITNTSGVPAVYKIGNDGEYNYIMRDGDTSWDGINSNRIACAVALPNNTNPYSCCANGSMLYLDYLKYTINGTLQQHLVYQYAATPVTDISGQNNQPASVSVRTTSSDADVTGAFANLRPMAAAVATYTPGGASELITTPPEMPDNMYDEDYDNIPGAAVVNTLLDAGNIPRTLFWFPAIILLAIAVGFGVCVLTRSLMGMALSMTAVIVIFSFMGPIPFWVIIPFGLFALAIIIKRENPGGF